MIKLSAKDKAIIARKKEKQELAKAKSKTKYSVKISHPSFDMVLNTGNKAKAESLKKANTAYIKANKDHEKAKKKLANLRLRGNTKITNKMIQDERKLYDKKLFAYSALTEKAQKLRENDISKKIYYEKTGNVHITERFTKNYDYVPKDSEYITVAVKLLVPYLSDTGTEYYMNEFKYMTVAQTGYLSIEELISHELGHGMKIDEDYVLDKAKVVSKMIYHTKESRAKEKARGYR